MEINDSFMTEWRKNYIQMVIDAKYAITRKLREYISINGYMKPPKDGILMKMAKAIDTVVLKRDDEYWKNFDQERMQLFFKKPEYINSVCKVMCRDNPDLAVQLEGLRTMLISILIMDDISRATSKGALLDVLRDFCEIYKNNPNISDMDAMISYILNYTGLKNTEAIGTIPDEIRSTLDLGLKTNLIGFVQRYAKEYQNEDLNIGGHSL